MRSVLFTFGIGEDFESESTQTIIDGYARKTGYNILVLDWKAHNSGNEMEVLKVIPKLGKAVGEKMKLAFGILIGNFEFVG